MATINLTSFTKSVDNIQRLSDKPNETDGLSAQGLKERFDRAGIDIKDFINGTMLKELETFLNRHETNISGSITEISNVKKDLDNLNDDYNITKELVSKKLDIYELSSTKVDTGKRENGKIIYAIEIPATLQNVDSQISVSNLNIEKITNFGGAYSDGANILPINYFVKFVGVDVAAVEYFISTSIYNNIIYLRNSPEYAGLSGNIIIEYIEKGV